MTRNNHARASRHDTGSAGGKLLTFDAALLER
jgi:hypothetical protein